jgi:phosphoenolpyruvate carboxykinase (ATP)
MYHFISGYTAKVAGTEAGVKQPQAVFSACFGEPFIVWHPAKYAEMLAAKLATHGATAWLINTGWTGGAYGVGSRMSLPHTRGIIDAIHSGELAGVEYHTTPVFNFSIPRSCPGVPDDVLDPALAWADSDAYFTQLRGLAERFNKNFEKYAAGSSDEIKSAGPRL